MAVFVVLNVIHGDFKYANYNFLVFSYNFGLKYDKKNDVKYYLGEIYPQNCTFAI